MPICKECGKDSFWSVDFSSKICKECNKKTKSKIREEKEKEQVERDTDLSIKYEVLEIYKNLVYLFMVVSTGLFIYYLVQIGNTMGGTSGGVIILTIITYSFSIFSLFCLIKMIDFLFDLDKNNKELRLGNN
jgi:hypothetical protein